MKNKILALHARYSSGDLQLSFLPHKHAVLSTHVVFSTPQDSVGGASGNINAKIHLPTFGELDSFFDWSPLRNCYKSYVFRQTCVFLVGQAGWRGIWRQKWEIKYSSWCKLLLFPEFFIENNGLEQKLFLESMDLKKINREILEVPKTTGNSSCYCFFFSICEFFLDRGFIDFLNFHKCFWFKKGVTIGLEQRWQINLIKAQRQNSKS